MVNQDENSAHLLRKKRFSLLFALLWFLVFGIGLLVYVLYYVSKEDDTVFLELNTQKLGENKKISLLSMDLRTVRGITGISFGRIILIIFILLMVYILYLLFAYNPSTNLSY